MNHITNRRHGGGIRLFCAALFLLALASLRAPATLQAAPLAQAIPNTLNYQGTLRDAQGNLVNGTLAVTIRIYDAAIDGTKLHEEMFSDVSVRDGVFNVVLGDQTPLASTLFVTGPRFIGITVAPDTTELLPRQRLHPAPWAQLATNALNAVNATNANNAANATNATNAANAATATTLVPNATVNGLTLGQGSKLTFSSGSSAWTIQPDASGVLRIVELNGGFLRLGINQNGNVQVPGDFWTRSVNFNNGAKITASGDDVQVQRTVNVTGKVIATQGFNGKCANVLNSVGASQFCDQDIAETFATDARTEPGDLVAFLPDDRDVPAVQLSTRPYDGALVGVVSTKPGLVFDQGETILAGDSGNLITDEKTVVAMVGRVPAKFSLENGPIAVGDPLTSSSTPGMAMKATQAGQIIGYAMQSSAVAEDGKILVWLQLGIHLPEAQLAALNSGAATAQSRNGLLPWGLSLLGVTIAGSVLVSNRFRRKELI